MAVAAPSLFAEQIRATDRARVLKAAINALTQEPVTITAFPAARSAGGRHDFFSEGDYWWPDPKNPNGPYLQRDGQTNPQNFVAHRKAMIAFSRQTASLVAAWRLTGEMRFARPAVRQLLAWFVDPATRMNPNLSFAQAIQGVTTGRGIGIIDTIHLIEPARGAWLLEQAGVLGGTEAASVQAWFREYLHWLTASKNGLEEKAAANNHGTCWAMQAAAFAFLVGEQKILAECRTRFQQTLLPDQMDPNGSFPRELKRTKPYGYSLFNLDAMCTLCQILSTPDKNLWQFAAPGGRDLRRGVEFLFPYIQDKNRWPYPKDVMYWEQWPVRSPALLFAGIAYRETRYLDLWKTLDPDPTNDEVLRNLPLREPVLWID